jgi:hypothetical protein
VDSESSPWIAILTGGGIAVFAFFLALLWDVVQAGRERKRRDKALLVSVRAEIESLIATVANNLNLVKTELQMLKTGTRLLNPLDPVAGGFWDVVRVNLPDALVSDSQVLDKLRDVSRRTEQVSEMIRSREAFE